MEASKLTNVELAEMDVRAHTLKDVYEAYIALTVDALTTVLTEIDEIHVEIQKRTRKGTN